MTREEAANTLKQIHDIDTIQQHFPPLEGVKIWQAILRAITELEANKHT